MQSGKRVKSVASFKHTINNTLAELSQVSMKQSEQQYNPLRPLRIILPAFFNVPRFIDETFDFSAFHAPEGLRVTPGVAVQKKLRDLSLLAEGMKRAKNIKDESRSYFVQAALLHNTKQYSQSAVVLQKFLKIVVGIKDERSIQLAWNALGIAYLHLGWAESKRGCILEALSCHVRHLEVASRDRFFAFVNIGMCLEALRRPAEAHSYYLQATQLPEHPSRTLFLHRLIARVQGNNQSIAFLTSTSHNPSHPPHQTSSPHTNHTSSPHTNHANPQKYNQAQINYAVSQAEAKLQTYFDKMKESMSKQI